MAKTRDKRKEEKKVAKEQPKVESQAAPESKADKKDGAKKGGGSTVISTHTGSRCKNDWQDKRYGKGNRLFNPSSMGLRCTVCHRGRDGQGVGRLSVRRQMIRDACGGFYKP